jgi:sodium/bile acid cotransporter 7
MSTPPGQGAPPGERAAPGGDAGTPVPRPATGPRRRWVPRALDPYVLALLGTAALAALVPVGGAAARGAGWAADGAIGLLFFLYGARLAPREAVAGLRQGRLHLTVLAATFVMFPLLGLASAALVPWALSGPLHTGVLYLCVVPSTVQSSIAMTSAARGNVPAAICAGTYSSLLGMVLTPLLAGWLIGARVGFSAGGLLAIAVQLVLPFLAGQALRPVIGGFVARHRARLGVLDRCSILLVVYTAFARGARAGLWRQVTPFRLGALLLVAAVLLAVALALTSFAAARLRFGTEDRIAIVFCGSKKSLATGLPMAAVLFGPAAGAVVLPLMLYHQLQLIVCAALAGRWGRRADPAARDLRASGPVPAAVVKG